MATGWNGSGTFTRGDGTREGATTWAQAKTAAQKVDAPPHDIHDQILAQGIQACLAKNGENAMTGNLNMGGFSLSNWTQASNVVLGTGVNFTMQGVFTTTSITASGVINSDTGITTEYLTAQDTITAPTLAITESSAFGGGSHVFTQNGTDTVISVIGSMADDGYLVRFQDSSAADVLLAHASGYARADTFRTQSITSTADTDYSIDMSGSAINFKFGSANILSLIEDEINFDTGIDIVAPQLRPTQMRLGTGTMASRQSAISDASASTASNTAKINEILAVLRTFGLIEP
jgi:hypothetical protein